MLQYCQSTKTCKKYTIHMENNNKNMTEITSERKQWRITCTLYVGDSENWVFVCSLSLSLSLALPLPLYLSHTHNFQQIVDSCHCKAYFEKGPAHRCYHFYTMYCQPSIAFYILSSCCNKHTMSHQIPWQIRAVSRWIKCWKSTNSRASWGNQNTFCKKS